MQHCFELEREGEKKKLFGVFIPDLGMDEIRNRAVTELGWLKAWENNTSWEVFKDSRNNRTELNIKYSMYSGL